MLRLNQNDDRVQYAQILLNDDNSRLNLSNCRALLNEPNFQVRGEITEVATNIFYSLNAALDLRQLGEALPALANEFTQLATDQIGPLTRNIIARAPAELQPVISAHIASIVNKIEQLQQ